MLERKGRPGHTELLVVLADVNAVRRRRLASIRGPVRVFQAVSLSEAYALVEEFCPDHLVVSEEFLAETAFNTVIRMASMIGMQIVVLSSSGTDRQFLLGDGLLRCIRLRESDDILDVISSTRPNSMITSEWDSSVMGPDLIVIGSSTGGVSLIESILTSFPADCPPTFIVQHMRSGFTAGLVQRLNNRCRPQVVLAQDQLSVSAGMVCFAGDSPFHLVVKVGARMKCSLVADPPRHGHRPSVDTLFESVISIAPRVRAALLTGMGRDGAQGMFALRQAGAFTIAQDQSTSVVWGMPGAAVQIGGACVVLPGNEIGQSLLRKTTLTNLGLRS